MKILVTDAFSSANRGDAAILDGILDGLAQRLPQASFVVASHFPELTRRFHGVQAFDARDAFALVSAIDAADLVVGCGGSYLHDTYARNLHPRLATIHAAARAGKRFVVFAQSIGPLDSALSRTAARNALDDATFVLVRDAASERVVRDLGVRAPIACGVDAAVLGRVSIQPRSERPTLGVTVRGWHFPGLEDPAAHQQRYEREVADAVSAWIAHTGGHVRILSNCTSLGGYAQDDRVVARRVAALVDATVEIVEAEDLPFDVVRGQAGACDFFLGTRMHSLLFATTAGVPGVGVAYEQKTVEWLEQVGLGGLHVPIEAPSGLVDLLVRSWDDREALRHAIDARLPALRARAGAQLDTLAGIARGELPPQERKQSPGRGDWNQETWRYDRPHRRLRGVADAVLSEASSGRVLDLGCSTGLLGRMLGPAFDYSGLDVAPSVAREEPSFRIRTGLIDAPWPFEGAFDVVTASGALEYADDLSRALERIREVLRPGGLAVVTLFNLAHVARAAGASRHPTWKFTERPDEFVLALREAGLSPTRLFASSAGRVGAPGVDAEQETDLDRAGANQLPLPTIFQLAHHVVAVCRAGEPAIGPREVRSRLESGALEGALEAAMLVVRDAPWSARAWSDLGILFHQAGDRTRARRFLEKALALDPTRPGVADDLAFLVGDHSDASAARARQ